MSNMDKLRQPVHDSTQVSAVYTATFPVLHLKHPIKLADLSRFAKDTLAMMISHHGLHRMTRLKLILLNSRFLLGMFLDAHGTTDVTRMALPRNVH